MSGLSIIEFGKHPTHWGLIKNPSHSYSEKNISCGEFFHISLNIENNTFTEIGFTGEGRLVAIASMSILAQEFEGEDINTVFEHDIDSLLELLEVEALTMKRMKSAALALLTFQNAILQWQKKPLKKLSDIYDQYNS
ncbi:hypothetical protein COB57_03865 [Candidatus Peregrinibacteria bacterium]|nr:MAG: hypothetical protein COB57_03865 [Candidatus Peregrinibacteria bacterium]